MARPFRFPFRSASKIAADIDEELAFHLANAASRLRANGWPAADAEAEARRRFGNVDYTKAYCRTEDLRREKEKTRMTLIDELQQDLRYAIRSLRAAPGFTIVALATLAIGIGANTAIFSVVRSVLLTPLPFASADRIVRLWDASPSAGIEEGTFSEPDFNDVRAASKRAASIGGYFFANGETGLDLTGNGPPERLSAALVAPGFFETLRPTPLLGRVLTAEEYDVGHNRTAVLGYGLWQRRFGGDRKIVGRSITLNGDPFTVVGVMGPEFTYPATQTLDAWIPLSYFGPDAIGRARPLHFISAIARLAPGTRPEQFRSEIAGIVNRLSRAYPDNPGWTSATVRPIRESIVGDVERPLYVLMAAVTMVLLITCVNIASLLLARASARQRELAVRAALGAGRGRIVRQLLTESLTLALIGGALGTLVGYVAVRALAANGVAQLPGGAEMHIDGTVLAFTVCVSLFAGLLFGVMPAARAAGPALERSLRAGTRGSVGSQGQRLRGGLVVIEVALAVILAAGASLATKSVVRLLSVDPGFQTSNALVVRLTIPDSYSDQESEVRYYEGILDAVRRIPGVVAAGAVKDLPTRGNGEMRRPAQLGLPEPRRGEGAPVQLHHVSPGYFKAMGIPLRGGREFTPADRAGMPVVFVVNEAAAKRFWPGETVAGKVLIAGSERIQIVGVVGDIRQRGLSDAVEPSVYISALQNTRSGMSVVIRTTGDPLRLANPVRQAIWSLDRNQTIAEVATLDQVVGGAVARPKLLAWLLGVFGVIGVLLGALGIYGLLAFSVAQRRQEIGVRTALGSPRSAVLRLVMGQGIVLAVSGVIIGTLAAQLLTRQMQSVLFGIAPSDPATYAEVIVALIGTAFVASWVPARRALAIDPVTALRYE
jgi:predicted permease